MSLIPKKGNIYVVDDDEAVRDRTLDALLQIVKGQYRGKEVDSKVRKEATQKLSNFVPQAATVVPVLIEILKTDKSEFNFFSQREGQFSRCDIVNLLAGPFSNHAKDAIPILEDEWILLKSKSPRDNANKSVNGVNAKALRDKIDLIKAANAPREEHTS